MYLSVKYSHPEWLVEKWISILDLIIYRRHCLKAIMKSRIYRKGEYTKTSKEDLRRICKKWIQAVEGKAVKEAII
jgi:hypothetical protein